MSKNKSGEKGFFKSYADDPLKADYEIFGRVASPTRRGFVSKASLLMLSGIIGANIPFSKYFPSGLIPIALADDLKDFKIEGKDGLFYFSDRPFTAETDIEYLDYDFTKPQHFFIRNNGVPPEMTSLDESKWTLEIDGESCLKPQVFKLSELKKKFKHYTYALTIECGGNGRGEIIPGTKGTQWGFGAVACGRWTGVRLKDILNACGVKNDAVYIGYYGADTRLDGGEASPISRGVPIAKALQNETLVAWSYEGQDIPWINGYPLRLVCGGYPGSVSGKWLKKISVRNKVHDGAHMASGYKVPKEALSPGETGKKPDGSSVEMRIIESMPVKSVITNPKKGLSFKINTDINLRGKAWAGESSVRDVFISINYGVTWTKARVEPPVNRLAWQKFSATISLPRKGYYEIWVRAVDKQGLSQPMVLAEWNPGGYINNTCHRISAYGI